MITCPECKRMHSFSDRDLPYCTLCDNTGEVPTRLEWLTIRARLRALALEVGELPARVITPRIADELRAARALLGLDRHEEG